MTQVINMRGKIAVLVSGVCRHHGNKKPIIKLELFQMHTAAIPRMGHHEDKARRLISLSHHCLFVMGFQQCFTNFKLTFLNFIFHFIRFSNTVKQKQEYKHLALQLECLQFRTQLSTNKQKTNKKKVNMGQPTNF